MPLRAPAWAWALLVAALVLFSALGTWQLQRGLHKQDWIARVSALPGEPQAVGPGTPAPAPSELRWVAARGVYEPGRQLLQDGQSRGGQPGYHVWTPLRLVGGGVLLVNRGWIPQPARLDQLPQPPAPDGEQAVTGWWRSLPEPGLRVGDEGCRPAPRFPQVVVYPTAGQLECLLGEAVLPGLLLQDPAASGGFVREWSQPGLPPQRHFGYAFTWYALGLTALFLFIKLNRTP